MAQLLNLGWNIIQYPFTNHPKPTFWVLVPSILTPKETGRKVFIKNPNVNPFWILEVKNIWQLAVNTIKRSPFKRTSSSSQGSMCNPFVHETQVTKFQKLNCCNIIMSIAQYQHLHYHWDIDANSSWSLNVNPGVNRILLGLVTPISSLEFGTLNGCSQRLTTIP